MIDDDPWDVTAVSSVARQVLDEVERAVIGERARSR